jgi:signal transduction histidine kinase
MPGIGVYETVINVPIRFEGIPYGLLTVLWLDRYDPTVESIAFLSAVAERLGSAIQNDLLRQKSEQTAVLEERQRLARELHDSVTQSVYSLTLLAEASQDLLTRGDFLRLKKCLSELGENSIQALKEMRMLLFELRPPQQGEQGLAKALQIRLEAVEQRAGVKAIFEVIETISLVPEIQEELYRVAIEALNNSLKHSGASSVLVKLRILDIGVQMAIEDNGKGFNPAADRSGGMGLNTMKERVSRLGGTLDIRSNPGQGTQVLVSLEK